MTTPFTPIISQQIRQAVTTSSTAALSLGAIVAPYLRIFVETSSVFLVFGTSAVADATTSGLFTPISNIIIMPWPTGATHVKAITASGSATLNIVPGYVGTN